MTNHHKKGYDVPMKMLGKCGRFKCGCCRDNTPARERRTNKRRERQAWKKEVGK